VYGATVTYRAIERGEFNVTLDTIVKIARRAASGHTLKTFDRLCRPRRGAVSLNPCPSVDDFRAEHPTRASRAPESFTSPPGRVQADEPNVLAGRGRR